MKGLPIVAALIGVVALAALAGLVGIFAGALLAILAEDALNASWTDVDVNWFARGFGALVAVATGGWLVRELLRLR